MQLVTDSHRTLGNKVFLVKRAGYGLSSQHCLLDVRLTLCISPALVLLHATKQALLVYPDTIAAGPLQ